MSKFSTPLLDVKVSSWLPVAEHALKTMIIIIITKYLRNFHFLHIKLVFVLRKVRALFVVKLCLETSIHAAASTIACFSTAESSWFYRHIQILLRSHNILCIVVLCPCTLKSNLHCKNSYQTLCIVLDSSSNNATSWFAYQKPFDWIMLIRRRFSCRKILHQLDISWSIIIFKYVQINFV